MSGESMDTLVKRRHRREGFVIYAVIAAPYALLIAAILLGFRGLR